MSFYEFMPTLLNMSLTASVAIVLVMLLRLLLKKAPKVISYALWGVVLFRLLCPVSIGSDFSVYNLFDVPTEESGTVTSVIEYVPSNIVHTEYPSVSLPVPGISDAINETLPQGEEQLRADPLEGPIFIATCVWMAGVLAMVIYSVVSYIRLRGKLSVVVPLRDNIFIADDIKSPFVVGLFRPKIYLPCNLGDKEQEYIILHEQHHIKWLDHIVKALAFLSLAIHWFNPLVWVAFILASKDMEMSCDEAVIRKIGGDVRADYSASLLTLATGRRIIAGTPLAFGEGDTKGRINNLSKWKKPAVWVVLVAVVACIVLAIGLLTNPAAEREFPINGSNVSDLDTEMVVEKIARAEGLENSSQLLVDTDNFDLMFTSDFNWANDGAIRFLYGQNQKYYSAQLRMFHDDNKYFITDRSEWIDPEKIFLLSHYLDALKYMPQEEIRQLSPDADGFSVFMRHEGTPGDYDRILKYNQNGVQESDGWLIHLEVQPLHEVEGGAYNGSGDEVIHLFYHSEQTKEQFTGELIPGTTYVSWQCLYMNPLSSYAAMGGDSGCRYLIDEDYFTTLYRNNDNFVSVTHPELDTAGDNANNMIPVPNWEWQEFPYTDEEWAALYIPQGFGGISNISETYDEMLYLPLTAGKFLLKMDNSLWLVELASNDQMGTYLWSIYSLVPESAMGVAQWEHAPMLSSRSPYFRFEFDMDYTEISAVCTQSLLVDRDAPGAPSDTSLIFEAGNALYWSPIDKDGNVVTAAIIHFSVHQGDIAPYSGTIYIEGNSGSDGRRIYNATIVGTGLHLDPNSEISGGVISAISHPLSNTETAFEANFGGNTSFGQKMKLTEDYPYWGIEIENTGNGTILMELQGEVYRVEAGTTKAFYADEKWEAGTYAVSFSGAGYQPMQGDVICIRSAVPMTDSQNTSEVTVKHDLTTGDLEVPVEDLSSYVFYTNSEQISVTAKGGDFDGQVNLLDVSQNNAHILQAKVNTRDDDCLFTGLTSARLYRVDCDNLNGCTVVISGDK